MSSVSAGDLDHVEVPGLGRRPVVREQSRFWAPTGLVSTVSLMATEFRLLKGWPWTDLFPVLPEMGPAWDQLDHPLERAVKSSEEERLGKIQVWFAGQWLEVQRRENHPQDQKVADPRVADLPATPAPVMWGRDLLTDEAHWAYPALVHSVYSQRGRIVDSGWVIRWFGDAIEASQLDAQARKEAESYITARRLEAELTANIVVGKLPVAWPAPYVAPGHTPEEILAVAGFTPDQYRIREDVGYWYSPGSPVGRDLDGEWDRGRPATGSLTRQIEDGSWEIGQTGLADVLRGAVIGTWNNQVGVKAVVAEMGAGDQIPAIQARLAAELEQAQENFRISVREFVGALQASPVHASLTRAVQDKLTKLVAMADNPEWGLPKLEELKDELELEWAKAEALHAHQAAGEALTNWGGHFRTMGNANNCNQWVVGPDGLIRHPDFVGFRKAYTDEGNKLWRLVGPEELALVWSKECTAADHDFTVVKRPVGSVTSAQQAAVRRIEREIADRYNLLRVSGWGLGGLELPPPAAMLVATTTELEPEVVVVVTPSPSGSAVAFTFTGGRNFRCDCGAIERVTKGDIRAYEAGESLEITCPGCGAHGTVSQD